MQSKKGFIGAVRRKADVVPRPLLMVSSAVALSLLGDQMLYAVLPIVYESVGVPLTAIGLLLSANRLVRLVTNSLAGYVIERFGRQWPFVFALLLGGLSTIAYGVVHGVWIFLAARLLWGAAWSFIRIEGMSTALDVASEETRGRYMGLFQAISRLGSAVAMLAGGILADLMGFRATFILFGCFTCLAALLAHTEMRSRQAKGQRHIVPESPTPPAGPPPDHPTASQDHAAPGHTDWQARRRMIVASFTTLSELLVIGGLVSATLGYMLRTRFGDAPSLGFMTIGIASLTGLLLSSRGFLDLGFAPLIGYLADRWGRHRVIVCGMPLAVLMIVILALLPPLPVVMAVTLLMFMAGTALHVALNAVAGDVAPPGKRSMFLSLFVTCQDLGAATGPLLGYWIAPTFGLVWLYLCGTVVLLVASGLYLVTFSRRV